MAQTQHLRSGLPDHIRTFMKELGYIHATDIEVASSSHKRTRQAWEGLRPVRFGNEYWYKLSDLGSHLEVLAKESNSEFVSL